MKIYNTLTRKKEEFKPISGKNIKMYICGPTVYDFAHIGNLRTYINEDLLRRTLIYSGYKVNQVMNITDIEDKIIKRAINEKKNFKDITKKYEKSFFDDLKKLSIEPVEHTPHATDLKVIKRMIEIIQKLLDKGFAYKSDDGSVYFSIKKFKDYGKLSGVDLLGTKEGARVSQDEYGKENPQDFALWKAKKEGEPSWPAPFGEGRPGWHIECSAMSTMILGETIDIHAGAVDLIFPHHENEIAQSEAFTGKPFVKYWFHPEHLLVEGKKMSKSLGNIYTLDEICKKYSVEPLAFRMLCLQSHYRDKLNFTEKSIKAAQNTLNGLRNELIRISQTTNTKQNKLDVSGWANEAKEKFEAVLDDDLNMPAALASVFDFIKTINIASESLNKKQSKELLNYFYDIDKVLGVGLKDIKTEKIPEKIKKLADDREKARKEGDYTKSDKIRAEIEKLGYAIEDTKNGPVTRKTP